MEAARLQAVRKGTELYSAPAHSLSPRRAEQPPVRFAVRHSASSSLVRRLRGLYINTVTKGYYAVEWKGPPLPTFRRMALETQFAHELEVVLGSAEAARELCLAASEAGGPALQALQQAAACAEGRVRASTAVSEGRFCIRAWRASDL